MEDQMFGENLQLKEFQCPICFKQFSRKFTLDMHLLIHKGVKPHPCPFCGKCFRQKGTLMRHKALHSSNNLFHCSLCDRGFRQKNVFLHHLKHRHSVSTETLDRRKYRTELKDYQSIMDTLPPFVHADSTAIASSEKHLDAMLFESLSHTVCDSSGADGTVEQLDKGCTDSKNVVCSDLQTSSLGEKCDFSEISHKSSFKGFGYECNFCLKMYFDYNQYKQHIEENHNNEEMLLECKPILLQSTYSEGETPPLDNIPCNNEESATKPKSVDNHPFTNDVPLQNSFNGVSSSNDVYENVNLCIPCQRNFGSSEEFECHVKTHVQRAPLSDSETNEDVKPTSLDPSSFSGSSGNICDNVSMTPSFTNTSEMVSQPLINTVVSKSEAVTTEMCNIKKIPAHSLVGNHFKNNVKLVSPVKSQFFAQSDCPDSVSSDISESPRIKKLKSSLFMDKKSFLYDAKKKSNPVPVLKRMSSLCNQPNSYNCKLCGKSYRSELSFEYHMQMHLSSKIFNCGCCKKRFSTKQLLLSHTRSAHMKTFQCSACFRIFNYRRLYFQHKKHCCETTSNLENLKKVINLPLVDIKKLLNCNTDGIIGVIPISDLGDSNGTTPKIGIPIISLSSIKHISGLPLLNSSMQISGVLK